MDAYRHFPIFIIAIPMVMAVLMQAIGYRRKELCMPFAAAALLSSTTLTFLLFRRVPAGDYLSYHMSGWPPPWGIEIRIDYIGLFVLMTICSISLLIAIFSRRYIHHELEEGKIPTYYSLFLLLTASMLGFTATGDIFNMFVFMEILALSSYALVAITARRNAVRAAFKYLLMGAPSSIMVLFAIALLYSVTGSLNMADLSSRIASSPYREALFASLILFMVGFGVKSALFPLHMWLPDAHSIAPSPISAMLSGLMVEVGAFAILRILFSVFTPSSSAVSGTGEALGVIAAAGVLFGGVMAISQKDFKMMIAYSTISHIGYILLGISMMNDKALTGAIFHIFDHGLAKACFFLCSGAFIYKKGYRRIEDLKGAGQQMPWTCFAFSLAALSVVGIPPSAGFISKWYLVWGSIAGGKYLYAVIFLVGSILAAAYCLRIIYYIFFVSPEEGKWQRETDDAPGEMLIPIWVLSLATLAMGILSFLVVPALQTAARAII
jgi:multicomponent Na+:H+ antiporter subunit D